VFDSVLKQEITNNFMKKSLVIKKARVNLAQRIGCIFLKPKIAKWRYQRGSRSLAMNLSGATSGIITSSTNITTVRHDQEEEVDDELEDEQYD